MSDATSDKHAAEQAVGALKAGGDYTGVLKLLLSLKRADRERLLKGIAKNTGISLSHAVRPDFDDLLSATANAASDKAAEARKASLDKLFTPPTIEEAVAVRDFLAVCVQALRSTRPSSDEDRSAALKDIRQAAEAAACLREFERDEPHSEAVLLSEVAFTEAAELLCIPLRVSLGGSLYTTANKDGCTFSKHLCSCILIDAQGSKSDGKGWCLRLLARNPAKEFKQVVLTFEDIAAGNVKTLAEAGVQISGKDRDVLMQLLSRIRAARLLTVADVQSGWIDPSNPNAFVFGTQVLTRDGVSSDILVQGGKELPSSGTLDEWKENVASVAVGNECYSAAILYGCMAPAKRLFGLPSGGSNAHGKSRSGKSTGSYMGLSLSEPSSGKLNYEGSSAGMERAYAQRNDRFVAMEGTERADPLAVQAFSYLAGDGITRVVAAAKSEREIRETTPFTVEIYSTGEESNRTLFEKAGHGYKNGAEARVPNIPHRKSTNNHGRADGARLAEDIAEACGHYYGTAFPAVVRLLMDPAVREVIKTRYDAMRALMTPAEADGEEHEVVKRFALAVAVGEACVRAGILPWKPDYPEQVMRSEHEHWLRGRGGHGVMSTLMGIDHACSFIFRNSQRFENKGGHGQDLPPFNKVGYRKTMKHGERAYEEFIIPSCQRKALMEVFGTSEYGSALAELEALTIAALRAEGAGSRPPLMLLTPKTGKLFTGTKPAKSDKGLLVKRYDEPSYVLLLPLGDTANAAEEGRAEAASPRGSERPAALTPLRRYGRLANAPRAPSPCTSA